MNNFGTVHLKDEKFNAAQTREMQLLIKIAPQRISYALINGKDNKLLVLYDSPIKSPIEETLNALLLENEYLRSTFSGIKISVQTSNFTFIPAQYYTRDNLHGYEKIVQANEGTKTFVSSINADGIKCITALELNVISPLISDFSEARFFSQAEPLIEAGLRKSVSATQKLVLQFNDDSFEACVTAEDKLVFYNLYAINNADDFNYYLLMIMQQLVIDTTNTSVIVAGNIGLDDENFKRIQKYFESIQFADCGEITNFSSDFDQLQKHKLYSLISLMLCE